MAKKNLSKSSDAKKRRDRSKVVKQASSGMTSSLLAVARKFVLGVRGSSARFAKKTAPPFVRDVMKFLRKAFNVLRLLGKDRVQLSKLALSRVGKYLAYIRKHFYAPFLSFSVRVCEKVHAHIKKRYGKTAFYIGSARRLALLRARFLNLPRPARLATYVSFIFIAWMLSGELPWFSSGVQNQLLEVGVPTVRAYQSYEQEYLPYLDLSGQTQASRQVVVRAETSGRVEGIFFTKGEYVEAGDALVSIDEATRPLELEEARTQLQQAQVEFTAIGSLARGGYRSELRRLQALSELNSARVREDRISRDLANTTPLAPFSGSIASFSVERGDFLSIGNDIAHLLDLDPLKVRVAVSERDISSVYLGARVSGELIIGDSFSGRIGTIAPTSNSKTRTFEVEILISNRDGRWREGLTAQVRLPIASSMAHLIPAALLSLSTDGSVGVKVIEDSIVRFRTIDIVGEEEDGVWVRGLGVSSLVISVGHENVSEGMEVGSVLDERFSSDAGRSRQGRGQQDSEREESEREESERDSGNDSSAPYFSPSGGFPPVQVGG